MEQYSVIMAVYEKENPEYLRQSIQSMLDQTAPTNDFVIICDGPLTDALNEVLNDFDKSFFGLFQFLRLPQNEGLGLALQKGLFLCRNELVARMDSDDVSVPERCQLQLKAFIQEPNLSLVGGQIVEFNSDLQKPYALRQVPQTEADIRRFSKNRNPFNHMTMMFRKSAVLAAGNYQACSLFEDYYLWIRMLAKGAKVCNLPEVLVNARAGDWMIKRRGGFYYAKKQVTFQRMLYTVGYITRCELLFNCIVRIVTSLVPTKGRQWFYQKFLRNNLN